MQVLQSLATVIFATLPSFPVIWTASLPVTSPTQTSNYRVRQKKLITTVRQIVWKVKNIFMKCIQYRFNSKIQCFLNGYFDLKIISCECWPPFLTRTAANNVLSSEVLHHSLSHFLRNRGDFLSLSWSITLPCKYSHRGQNHKEQD